MRYLRTADAVRPLKVIPPLRVLVIASAPKEMRQLAAGDEIENVGEKPSIKQPQLRYFRDTDAAEADKICAFLAPHINAVKTRISGYENSPLVRPNQFELWLAAAPPDAR